MRNILIRFCILTLFGTVISCANDTAQAPIPLGVALDTAYLHKFTKVNVSLITAWTEEATTKRDTTIFNKTISTASYQVYFVNDITLLKWNGYDFKADTSYSWHSEPQPPDYRGDAANGSASYKLTGTITSQNTIAGSCLYSHSGYGRNHWGMVYENGSTGRSISYQLIPAITKKDDTLIFSLSGSQLKSFISEFSNDKIEINEDITKTTFLKTVLWDTIPEPVLKIRFFK